MTKWTRPASLEALHGFAASAGVTVFTDVPVVGPAWRGWSSECPRRVLDVAVAGPGTGAVGPFEEDDFVAALASGRSVHPLNTWGFADRTVFGHLATHQAFLERTWHPSGTVQSIALVAPGQCESNVAAAYLAAGFLIKEMPGDKPRTRRGGGGAGGRNDPWNAPQSKEDRLLHDLWDQRGRKGWWLAEVPVGFKLRHDEAGARRLDAVVVDWPGERHSSGQEDLTELADVVAKGAAVELIEAKRDLNTDALGQLLCGERMFAESWPGVGHLVLTACVGKSCDEALSWFCSERGISVEVPQAS